MDKVTHDLIKQISDLIAFKKALKDLKVDAPELHELADEEMLINIRALQHMKGR